MSADRFKDQVVVVTGGSQGIGFGVAKRMAAEGARVAIWSLGNTDDAAASLGGPALGIQTDVTSEESVAAALAATLAAFGKIDVLVTAAGIGDPQRPVLNLDFEAWKNVLNVNLNGTFLCCRAVLEGMIEHNYGRIVTIASLAGKEPKPNISAYASSKAAVIAFTKSLGKELAATNIRANTIAPAVVRTPMIENMRPDSIKMIVSMVPQQRMGTIEECAAMIGFMASAECSFSSGAVFDLSGGVASY